MSKPATTMSSDEASADRPKTRGAGRGSSTERRLQFALGVLRLGPLLILVVLFVLMASLSDFFLTGRNIQNVLVQSSVIAVLAIGQLLVIVTRGIDLSVGSLLALSAVVGGVAFQNGIDGGAEVIFIMIATGALVGLFNGVAFVGGRLPHAFIVTLATLGVARGLALILSDSQTLPGMPQAVITAGSGFVGPIPVPAIIAGVLLLTFLLVARYTQWGRWIYAVGGNPEAAKRVGIPVGRVLISVYVLSGLCAGIAAVLTAGRTGAASPTDGTLFELDAITAVFIGGASFLGGRGSVPNAVVGALAIGVIRNGLNLMGVTAAWQLTVIGLIVLVAVELDVVRAHLERRIRTLRAIER